LYERIGGKVNKKETWVNAPEETPEEKIGFVYAVTRLSDNMTYYGIKKYWKTVKYPPLKGRKNKRHIKRETDWRTYKTSNTMLQEELEKNPKEYRCEIIKDCDTVTELKCREAYIQLTEYFRDGGRYMINEMINLRLRIRKDEK
jgi:hypothetical protein